MLDLQKTVKELYYEIRLLDGKELQLKRPTQGMIEFVIGLQDYLNTNKELEAINGFTELFVKMLNRNINNVSFTSEEISEEYDIAVIVIAIKDYFRFWNEDLTKRVNFQ